MFIYILVFIVALFIHLIARKSNSKLLLAAYILYLAIFVGLGDMIGGYDRYIYGEVFDTIADEIRSGAPEISDILYLVEGREYGYFFWQIFCSLFTANRYVYILLTTLLIYALFYKGIIDYFDDYPLACVVFLGLLYYFSMTYLRQIIAVGIVLQSVKYIVKRQFLNFGILVLLAYSFHGSAIIFFPMYFVPLKKYGKKTVLTALCICLFIGLTPLPNILLSSGSSISGKRSGYEDQDQGFRPEYVLEVILFIWIFFKNFKKINDSPQTLVFLNMSYVFCAILFLFIQFGQGGRFGWYFMPGVMYMLTYLVDRKDAYRWMHSLVLCLSFALFLRITMAWQTLNEPYKTFFTNGEPSGSGYIYERYEYDLNYTVDKLYK